MNVHIALTIVFLPARLPLAHVYKRTDFYANTHALAGMHTHTYARKHAHFPILGRISVINLHIAPPIVHAIIFLPPRLPHMHKRTDLYVNTHALARMHTRTYARRRVHIHILARMYVMNLHIAPMIAHAIFSCPLVSR